MKPLPWTLLLVVLILVFTQPVYSQSPKHQEFAASLGKLEIAGLIPTSIGVTRRGTPMPALVNREDFDLHTKKTRILLVGGLDGSRASVARTIESLRWFQTSQQAAPLRNQFLLSAVLCANPDALAAGKGPQNTSSGNPTRGYPPQGNSYNSKTDPEAAYLWRWIGMHAPDLVVELGDGKTLSWHVADSPKLTDHSLVGLLKPHHNSDVQNDLVSQLVVEPPSETGVINAVQVQTPDANFLKTLLAKLSISSFHGPSPARKTLQQRLNRSPLEIAGQLSKVYGHDLNRVAYIPALALIGRIRHEQLTGQAGHRQDVEKIVAPYFLGDKETSPTSGSALSGHLIFCELASISQGKQRQRYLQLAKNAADLIFDERGKSKPSMPFHVEMSDSVFMGGPILARVGRLSGEVRYFDACAKHLEFMRKLDLRDDGIYRNSPLNQAAWGRGNGFPALGLAMCLTDFPANHPRRGELLKAFQSHLAALAKHQDLNGCWHQVIDHPESYRELTATCMITFAMIRGVRKGWLDENTYAPRIQKTWYAIRTRIASDGRLVDVCTGTGKQTSLHAYFDRTAILGRDPRGGAMSLMVTTELARWQAEQK